MKNIPDQEPVKAVFEKIEDKYGFGAHAKEVSEWEERLRQLANAQEQTAITVEAIKDDEVCSTLTVIYTPEEECDYKKHFGYLPDKKPREREPARYRVLTNSGNESELSKFDLLCGLRDVRVDGFKLRFREPTKY